MLIEASIVKVQQRHEEAATVIDAAMLLAKRNQPSRALKVLMDFEGPTRDALDLLKTALTIRRELLPPPE